MLGWAIPSSQQDILHLTMLIQVHDAADGDREGASDTKNQLHNDLKRLAN